MAPQGPSVLWPLVGELEERVTAVPTASGTSAGALGSGCRGRADAPDSAVTQAWLGGNPGCRAPRGGLSGNTQLWDSPRF